MDTLDSYDQIPYDAVPITDTHPDHLCVLGRLFGLNAAAPERCRVLELGCADGANIIPLAYYLPESTFVGVELSRVQVDAGAALIQDLQLTNIALLHQDIMAPWKDAGEFDYIIAHGIYSWIPAPARERILELCGALLAPAGIAYVSFNTLPGWRARSMIRDMLLHHCRHTQEPRARLKAAQEMLELLEQGWAELDSPAIDWLKQEVAHLRKASRSYLFHEYLEDTNEPVLFSTFMAAAERHGLKYVADSDLYTMLPSTLGASAARVVERFDDLLEQEQYMDFLRARPFRRTLLCRAPRELERELNLGALRQFGIAAYLMPSAEPVLDVAQPQTYRASSGKIFSITHPVTKLALRHLAEHFPNTLTLDALENLVLPTPVKAKDGTQIQQREALAGELFSLFAARAVLLTPRTQRYFNTLSERPRAHALAQAQARRGHVASVRHVDIDLDAVSRRLLALLDGAHSHLMLAEELTRLVQSDVELRKTLEHTHDARALPERVQANVQRLLALFARHGLLEM